MEHTNANVCYVILREFPFFESALFWVGNIMTLMTHVKFPGLAQSDRDHL